MIISASHWQEVDTDEWPAKHFSPKECADSLDGSILVDRDALLALDVIRSEMNCPLKVSSWYRTPAHDAAIKGSGAHTTGSAIDVLVSGSKARAFVALAVKHGFSGIGVSQSGPHESRFIHIDMMDGTATRPRPWIWSY